MNFSKVLPALLLFTATGAFAAKQDTTGIRSATQQLDEALLQRDTVLLKKLLHPDLTYGHSNGWVESRQEVLSDLFNGKLAYKTISEQSWNASLAGDVALVRSNINVVVLMQDQPLSFSLHVLQVWKRTGKSRWVLLARQSGKRG